MEQLKIGKFIACLRKEKGLTQKELAEKIGITDRAISKWENGRGLPDISLLRKLSDVLGVSTNELLSAQKVKEDNVSKFEESYYNAINTKSKLQSDIVGYLVYKIIGYILLIISLDSFTSEGWWISLVSIVGSIFVIISSYKLVRSYNIFVKVGSVFIVSLILLILIRHFDYNAVLEQNISKPHFYYSKVNKNNCTIYKSINYKCLRNNNPIVGREKICDIVTDEDEIVLNSDYCTK